MHRYKMNIDGQWVGGASDTYFPTINPANQEVWAEVAQATEQDVDAAIDAAHRAQRERWGRIDPAERAACLFRLADLLDAEAGRMAELETTDNGKLIGETTLNMRGAAHAYRFFAGYADKLVTDVIPLGNENLFDYTLREPLGVIGIITPWNSPIHILSSTLAPALAVGNAAVIKPSEHTSVTTIEFSRLALQAGIPEGVINVVTGDARVGECLTRSPRISKISFTGGPEAGRRVAFNAAQNLIPVGLELGGKSPNIIFDDADLERAIDGAVRGIFGSAGQVCVAGSRLLVQRGVAGRIADAVVMRAKALRVGPPLDPASQMGPVATRAQYDRILGLIAGAANDGADVPAGGGAVEDAAAAGGLYIQPTVLTGVDNTMHIAREEVFGPVLSVIEFDDEEEAIAIANDSPFGLASGIWTRDVSRAHRVARRMECGQVWINTYKTSGPQVPFGGTKNSGYGRVRGQQALFEYTRLKNVLLDIS